MRAGTNESGKRRGAVVKCRRDLAQPGRIRIEERYAMKRRGRIMMLLAMAAAVSLPVMAQDKFERVEQRIRTLAPSVRSLAVAETPVEGLLQVQINGDIVYVTDDGKYLFEGRLIDLDTRDDLTELSKASLRKEVLDHADMSKAITFAPEHPAYDLTVFTDVDCGYCRKLHSQIAEYNKQGIAIHYMAFPRAGIGSVSYDKFVSVWCAKDQQGALTNAKLGNDPEPQQCDNPVAEQYQLGLELGVSGTPALMTSSGQLIPGYVPPEALRARLDQMAAAGSSSAR
jgi:thiol:disulfide interchange protein DsbC